MYQNELIYDWNISDLSLVNKPAQKFEFHDETLRDGLQSPSLTLPSFEENIKIIQLMDRLGIDSADLGFPGAGEKEKQRVLEVAKHFSKNKHNISLSCIARTLEQDVACIVDLVQQLGDKLHVFVFIGSSFIRQEIEKWSLDLLLQYTKTSILFAKKNGLEVTYVTEDSTRTSPEMLKSLYLTAIDCGVERICLCDTVGHADPNGIYNLIKYMKNLLKVKGIDHVKVDFHGHMDRGLGVWNSIKALEAGADRIHASALGLGERAGNTPMDQLLINLKLMGWIDKDLKVLNQYVHDIANYTKVSIPKNYPMMGDDVFETTTGIHASAVLKAMKTGNQWLSERIYTSIPSSWLGKEQVLRIGPLSGKANVIFWLENNGVEYNENMVHKILNHAKLTNHTLSDEEIKSIIND